MDGGAKMRSPHLGHVLMMAEPEVEARLGAGAREGGGTFLPLEGVMCQEGFREQVTLTLSVWCILCILVVFLPTHMACL